MPQTPHMEQHFTAGETIRDIVIGMSDGLTVPFALAAGLTGAVSATSIIVTAGASGGRRRVHSDGSGGIPGCQERCRALRQRAHQGAARSQREA